MRTKLKAIAVVVVLVVVSIIPLGCGESSITTVPTSSSRSAPPIPKAKQTAVEEQDRATKK